MAIKTTQIFDKYSLRARLYPASLVISPILILAYFLSNEYNQPLYFYITSIVAFPAITFFLSQIGRDRGKLKEHELYKSWGGKPTTIILRYKDNHLDKFTKERYLETLSTLLPDLIIPNQRQEEEKPIEADEVYESCGKFLISKTRDTQKYNLLFNENINFGFRRNLWGMKAIAISVAIICILILLGINFIQTGDNKFNIKPSGITIISILSVYLIVWIFILNRKWVRIAGFAYAERLMESIDTIDK